jgi:peptidoglycan/xylan/chitin deacetylase (PgdA/CDA1 family)
MVQHTHNGREFPPRAVVVTFDDGFRNNYSVAAPILDDLGVPATFYVCAGMINTDLMFWVDVIEDCINLTEKRLLTLQLTDGDLPEFRVGQCRSQDCGGAGHQKRLQASQRR